MSPLIEIALKAKEEKANKITMTMNVEEYVRFLQALDMTAKGVKQLFGLLNETDKTLIKENGNETYRDA